MLSPLGNSVAGTGCPAFARMKRSHFSCCTGCAQYRCCQILSAPFNVKRAYISQEDACRHKLSLIGECYHGTPPLGAPGTPQHGTGAPATAGSLQRSAPSGMLLGMLILVAPPDAALVAQLDEALGDEFVVAAWLLEDPAPPQARLAIIDSLEHVIAAHEAPFDILAVVDAEEMRWFPECPREIRDFIVKPASIEELATRVRQISATASLFERTRQHLLASAVAYATDIIALLRDDGAVEYVNAAYDRTLRSPKSMAGRRAPHLDPDHTSFHAQAQAAFSRGEAWSGTIVAEHREGRSVQLDTTITPITNSKGRITHHVAVKRDVTERLAAQAALVEANRMLEQARDEALAASRAKTEFLANMSHELRTPLNAIMGYGEMVLETVADDPQSVKDMERILSSSRQLLGIINDLLDIAKIEADRIDLHPEKFDIQPFVEDVVDAIRPRARIANNTIDVEAEQGAVYADLQRLRQVVLNLLSNACKFTERGTIRVAVTFTKVGQTRWLTIAVGDTGIGISDEHRVRIFRPFSQADGSATRRHDGTGLGLVISKRLAELMGGDIEMQSTVGVGSTFTVRVPADGVESQTLPSRKTQAPETGHPTPSPALEE